MAVTLVFLGKLADVGGDERELAGPLDWPGLLAALEPDLAALLAADNVKCALNGSLLPDKTGLDAQDGDELAFLPPVSGG